MKTSSGHMPHFCGTWTKGHAYSSGAMVIARGAVLISAEDNNTKNVDVGVTFGQPGAWVLLGQAGPSPTVVSHKWHPVEVQYPCGDSSEMSEKATVCGDCWKDADYRNAFRPQVHLYVIRELGLP